MKSIVAGVLVLTCLVIAAFAVQPDDAANKVKDATATTKVVAADPEKTKVENEEKLVYFQMTTSLGELYLELNNEKAPISTANFLSYVEDGYYDGTIFHRVMSGFMIQGGGFDVDMNKKDTKPGIENEWTNGLSNVKGSIAMARLGNQANSGTSQFFINVTDNGFLDQPRDGSGYAVFGRIAKGMDVVDKIRAVAVGTKRGMANVPVEPVVIEKVVLLDAEQAEELGLVAADD